MKKKSFLISTLGLIGLLASCNTVVNNTTTSTNSGSNTGSSNNSNVSETSVSNDFTATQEFNVTTASGLAPVVNINSIDTSVLTTENSGSVYEVNADNVISETLYNGLDITAVKNSTINLTLNNATIYQNSETGKALWNDNKGLTLITGPTSGGNQAIDSDSKAYFNGGEVLSIGSSGMASTKEYSSSNSTCVFGLYQSYSSNTIISILDSDGNVLISVVAPTSFGELVYSSSSLKLNSTYTVVIGSTNQTITLTSQVTSSGNSNIGFGPGNDGGHGDNPGMIGRR